MQRSIFVWIRRLTQLALAVALLAGCGGLGAGLGREPVTVQFLYLDKVADYEPLAQEFTRQHPNITIKLDPVPLQGGNIEAAISAKLADADAIRLPAIMIPQELFPGLLPLDTQITTSKSFPMSDLFPGSLDGLKLNGKQVGIPAGLNPFVVYYSPARFKAVGVQPPMPDWTLEEFVNKAQAVNHPEDSLAGTPKYAYGFCSNPAFTDGAIFTYLFGGGLFDSLTAVSHPTLNLEQNVAALDWYVSLRKEMGIMPPGNNPRDVGQLVFRSSCGFWIDWLDRSTFYGGGPDDATPLPLPSYKAQFNVATLDGYFILSKTEHSEEAWQWISFLMGQESASGQLIPPLQSQVNSQAYSARVPNATAAIARTLPPQMAVLGMEMYRNQRFGQVIDLFGKAAVKVFNGDSNAQTALNDAQQQAEQVFK